MIEYLDLCGNIKWVISSLWGGARGIGCAAVVYIWGRGIGCAAVAFLILIWNLKTLRHKYSAIMDISKSISTFQVPVYLFKNTPVLRKGFMSLKSWIFCRTDLGLICYDLGMWKWAWLINIIIIPCGRGILHNWYPYYTYNIHDLIVVACSVVFLTYKIIYLILALGMVPS